MNADQSTLFDPAVPLTRHRDPAGSLDAAASVRKHGRSVVDDILRALSTGPLRAAQIAAMYPERNDGTIRTACSRLVRSGHIEVVEQQETPSGRREALYSLRNVL